VEVEVVERRKQTEVQTEEIQRRQRELDATVKQPADAERFRVETIASAERARLIAEAEGEAESIRLRGEAEADAIRAIGRAEAEAMLVKADSWKEYGQAAILEQLFEVLPEVASAVSAPLAKTEKIVMIGGSDGSVGPSRITKEVTNVVAQIPEIVEALSGIDILGTIRNLRGVVSQDDIDGDSDDAGGDE